MVGCLTKTHHGALVIHETQQVGLFVYSQRGGTQDEKTTPVVNSITSQPVVLLHRCTVDDQVFQYPKHCTQKYGTPPSCKCPLDSSLTDRPNVLRGCMGFLFFWNSKHVRYRRFDDWDSAATFLRTENGCDLCGIVFQSHNASTGISLPPRGASPARLGSPAVAAAVAESAHPGDKENGGASSISSTTTSRETATIPAFEGCTPGACSEILEEASSSSSSLMSPECLRGEQRRRRGRGGDIKDCALPSTPVRRRPFRRSTAFLVGHRNRLEGEALDVCDFLVHIEQVVYKCFWQARKRTARIFENNMGLLSHVLPCIDVGQEPEKGSTVGHACSCFWVSCMKADCIYIVLLFKYTTQLTACIPG